MTKIHVACIYVTVIPVLIEMWYTLWYVVLRTEALVMSAVPGYDGFVYDRYACNRRLQNVFYTL